MSVLFPKVNKAPEWHWRPIYYDPKKDEMDRKLRELQQRRAAEEASAAADTQHSDPSDSRGDNPSVSNNAGKTSGHYTPTLHRGSFRESHEENMSPVQRASRQSKAAFWVALLLMLAFLYWLL